MLADNGPADLRIYKQGAPGQTLQLVQVKPGRAEHVFERLTSKHALAKYKGMQLVVPSGQENFRHGHSSAVQYGRRVTVRSQAASNERVRRMVSSRGAAAEYFRALRPDVRAAAARTGLQGAAAGALVGVYQLDSIATGPSAFWQVPACMCLEVHTPALASALSSCSLGQQRCHLLHARSESDWHCHACLLGHDCFKPLPVSPLAQSPVGSLTPQGHTLRPSICCRCDAPWPDWPVPCWQALWLTSAHCMCTAAGAALTAGSIAIEHVRQQGGWWAEGAAAVVLEAAMLGALAGGAGGAVTVLTTSGLAGTLSSGMLTTAYCTLKSGDRASAVRNVAGGVACTAGAMAAQALLCPAIAAASGPAAGVLCPLTVFEAAMTARHVADQLVSRCASCRLLTGTGAVQV